MEIISIYCFIAFILGAVFMLTIHCIAAMGKVQEQCNNVQEPINKVHFYVARDKKGALWLYLKKPVRSSQMFLSGHWGKIITKENYFSKYGLNKNDFDNLKWEDEPVEVFINMEECV